MGLFDKAKDLAGKAGDAADMAEEHADKLPGDMGGKVAGVAKQVGDVADKISGEGEDEDEGSKES